MLHRLTSLLLALLLVVAPFEGARASQGSLIMPTTGTVSGLSLVNDINSALDALVTCNSGATQPLNSSAAPSAGQFWCDNSVSGKITLKQYDGTSWLAVAALDSTNHVWTPPIGGGFGTSLASGSTVDLGSVPQSAVTITGTTTITSFGSSAVVGTVHLFKFAGALTLTHNATSLFLPNNGANITTAAGDWGVGIYLGSGNWAVLIYQPATGAALNASSNFQGAVFVNAQISPSSLSTSQNNWNPSGLSTANLIRISSSAAVNITGLTAPVTNGQRITLQNINAASGSVITLTANDASSSAANRFLFPHPAGLLPGQALTIVYDLTSGGWRFESVLRAQPVAGGFKNLRVFNVATAMGDSAPATPNVQMTIAADEITVEDVNGGAVRLGAFTCLLDISGSSFSAGNGGLDTGAATAGNWYSEWVIFNPTTNTTSCLASLQQNAFTGSHIALPAGFTSAARVGWNRYLTNNAVTGFQRLVQYGRRAHYVVTSGTPTPALPTVTSGAKGTYSDVTPTYASASVSNFVPTTAASIWVAVNSNLNGLGSSRYAVAPSSAYSGSESTNSPPFAFTGTGLPLLVQTGQMTLEGSSIAVASDGAGFAVLGDGWDDSL